MPSNSLDISSTGIPSYNSGVFSASTTTAHNVLVGAATNSIANVPPSTAGYVLTSNGASADPSFQAAAASGPPFTTDTKSYSVPSTFQSGGVQSSALSTTLTGTPTKLGWQQLYLSNNTSGGNGWCICADMQNAAYIYLFTLTNGTWAYSDSKALAIGGHVELRVDGNGSFAVLQSTLNSNWSLITYTPAAGLIGSATTVDSGTSSGVNQPCGLTWVNNVLAYYGGTGTQLNAWYFSGGTWHQMTNSPRAVTAVSSGVCGHCISLSQSNQIAYGRLTATPGYTIDFYPISGGTSLGASAQTITLSGNGPDGNTHAGWTTVTMMQDNTDGTYPYLHVCNLDTPDASNNTGTGAIWSYQYTGGTWTYRNALYPTSTASAFIGYGEQSGTGVGSGAFQNTGQQCFLSGSTEFLYTQRWSNANGYLYTLTKTVGAPYIAYSLAQTFAWPASTLTNCYATASIDAQFGKWISLFDNQNNTGSNRYLRWFPMGSGSTVDVDYQKTVDNLEMGRAYFNDLITLPVLSGGTIGSENVTSDPGTLVINSTIGALQLFYNGVWNVIPFQNLGSGGYPASSYIQNSGDISITGRVLNVHGLSILTGSNQTMGTSGALSSGTVTVSTTAVLTGSKIFLTRAVAGGTLGNLSVGTITNATSFTITSSSSSDTSTVNWLIIQQAAQ